MSSNRRGGPPKHQNRYAWKPNAGHQKNETELGGNFRPYSKIIGVCARCKDQIEWKRSHSCWECYHELRVSKWDTAKNYGGETPRKNSVMDVGHIPDTLKLKVE